MNETIREAIEMIRKVEAEHDVTIVARGGAYGSSRLIVIDNRTNEEYNLDDYE
jgi:hypothetical protein